MIITNIEVEAVEEDNFSINVGLINCSSAKTTELLIFLKHAVDNDLDIKGLVKEFEDKCDVRATLENWTFHSGRIYGDVYNDKAGEFKDGVIIRTSTLLTPKEHIVEGAIVKTKNSKYKLGKKDS